MDCVLARTHQHRRSGHGLLRSERPLKQPNVGSFDDRFASGIMDHGSTHFFIIGSSDDSDQKGLGLHGQLLRMPFSSRHGGRAGKEIDQLERECN